VATQSLWSNELELYDSGTAEIQSFHRTASVRVVRVSRQQMEGGQIMIAHDSNVVNPHIRRNTGEARARRGC